MLLSVSISHRTAGFDLLDRLSAAAAERTPTDLLGDEVQGAVLLATCNRVETYLDVPNARVESAAAGAIAALATAIGLAPAELSASVAVASGAEALRHLFAVTAGLESLAVGEDEIAGQVKRAYDLARTAGATTPELDRAFQRAAKVSRDVRASTELGTMGRSLVQFALQLASHRVQDWRGVKALVVGTGNYAATTIQSLRGLGVRELTVYSATGRAAAFADRYGIRAAGDLATAIADADVVVTCTRAYTVTPSHLPGDGAPRLIIDLGLPRNVESEVGRLNGVDLLDLELIARHAGLPEFAHEDEARSLIDDAACRYAAEQLATPAVVALRGRVFDALDAEIARVVARAESPAEAALAVEALRHLAGVLLHTPSERARSAAAAGRIADFEAAIGEVYGLDVAADPHGAVPIRFLDESRRGSSVDGASTSGPDSATA